MSRPRFKKMKEEEFRKILEKGRWVPYRLVGKMPDWMKNIPTSKIHSIYASGSKVKPKKEAGYDNVIGGMDIIRYAEEKDGVRFNKDHVIIIKDPKNDDMLLVIETPKEEDSEHWIDEIPERLKKAEIIELI